MYFKSVYDKKFDKWSLISDLLIRKAIFYDDEELEGDAMIPVTSRAEKLMSNKYFRKLLVNEITSAKKSITGISADNLKHLYVQQGLDKYALNNLSSGRWYIRAKAVQELTIMDMHEFVEQICLYTDDKNDLVRMEAQSALVHFNGFDGLHFLDTVTYPISNWQQIKLLQQLSNVSPSQIDMSPWFKSANSTVIVFALKLARTYQRFDLYYDIVSCLDHSDPTVRYEAIHCLKDIYTDETSDDLISRFLHEILKNQLAMIKVMETVGTDKDLLFLLDLLTYENDEIKIHAARALVQSNKDGMISLEKYSREENQSIKEIVMHIKGEIAA
ncbi:MAG: HEAT repeat domain-containing protein [Mucilaginibacter sp.]|nr:HEAT repeat domain-containing protein [Mucilaginibacter sp.]